MIKFILIFQDSVALVNDDDRKLFAGGLAQEATEKDLKEYFAKFGEVASVTLKMDQMTGRSR
jgi:RNA recognition motif-containing protein